jgi:hypothetical protein
MKVFAQAGMKWWNSLSEEDRRFWLSAAITGVPAQAWAYYRRCNPGATS